MEALVQSKNEKILEALHESEWQVQNLTDLIIPQNFQIQNPYSIFQFPPQQEEPSDFEKSMEYMIQSQNSFTQSTYKLKAKISQLANIYRNEKPLFYQYLTNPNISNPIHLAQESCCFRN